MTQSCQDTSLYKLCHSLESYLYLLVYAPVAQLVEHLIEDQGVGGSNPSGSTIIFFAGISRVNTLYYYADVAELVDAPVLGTGIVMVWGFESLHPHQN